jgi:hypothetical protein
VIEFVLLNEPEKGKRVNVQVADARLLVLSGLVTRCEDHQVQVDVLGASLPFQRHDGQRWSYVEVAQDEPRTDE